MSFIRVSVENIFTLTFDTMREDTTFTLPVASCLRLTRYEAHWYWPMDQSEFDNELQVEKLLKLSAIEITHSQELVDSKHTHAHAQLPSMKRVNGTKSEI